MWNIDPFSSKLSTEQSSCILWSGWHPPHPPLDLDNKIKKSSDQQCIQQLSGNIFEDFDSDFEISAMFCVPC